MAATLDEIGLRFGTDKTSQFHNYLSFYESFMAPMREAPITLLEVGVFRGASLNMWREYFPNAKIVGVDIQPTAKQFESERVHVELADQSNLQHLAEVAVKHGPFDIVIEDGSHMWEHQITSLRALFPFVKNGGYYVVEDLQTNYGALRDKYRGVSSETCVSFLKRWMDIFVADDLVDLSTVEDAFLRTYGRSIESMAFHRRACVVRKRVLQVDWRVSRGEPLVPKPADALQVTLSAHLGMRGDIFGPAGYVDEGADLFTFQGLTLESETGALEYRVCAPDGAWGDWVGEGVFAGTRGLARAISGVSVRISESAKAQFTVDTHGLFVGALTADATSGELCAVESGAALRGLQVTLRPKVAALVA
jgi:hypothetical protein